MRLVSSRLVASRGSLLRERRGGQGFVSPARGFLNPAWTAAIPRALGTTLPRAVTGSRLGAVHTCPDARDVPSRRRNKPPPTLPPATKPPRDARREAPGNSAAGTTPQQPEHRSKHRASRLGARHRTVTRHGQNQAMTNPRPA